GAGSRCPLHRHSRLICYPGKCADTNSDRGEPASDCQPTNPPASGRPATSRPHRRNALEGPPALPPTVLLLFGLLGLGESPPQARAAETVAHDVARVRKKAHQDNQLRRRGKRQEPYEKRNEPEREPDLGRTQ